MPPKPSYATASPARPTASQGPGPGTPGPSGSSPVDHAGHLIGTPTGPKPDSTRPPQPSHQLGGPGGLTAPTIQQPVLRNFLGANGAGLPSPGLQRNSLPAGGAFMKRADQAQEQPQQQAQDHSVSHSANEKTQVIHPQPGLSGTISGSVATVCQPSGHAHGHEHHTSGVSSVPRQQTAFSPVDHTSRPPASYAAANQPPLPPSAVMPSKSAVMPSKIPSCGSRTAPTAAPDQPGPGPVTRKASGKLPTASTIINVHECDDPHLMKELLSNLKGSCKEAEKTFDDKIRVSMRLRFSLQKTPKS